LIIVARWRFASVAPYKAYPFRICRVNAGLERKGLCCETGMRRRGRRLEQCSLSSAREVRKQERRVKVNEK
jgi:hypothetical protein